MGKERYYREEHRVKRTEREIKNRKAVKNFIPEDYMIIQNVDKDGMWVKGGQISHATQRKNSYVINLEDGSQLERYHHHI